MTTKKFVYVPCFDESYLDISEFPDCCGAEILSSFNSHENYLPDWNDQVYDWMDDNPTAKRPKEPSKKFFQELHKKAVAQSISRSDKGTITFAILAEFQYYLKPVLLAKGFREISDRTVNARTSNRLHIFLRDIRTPKGKKLKKRRF